ncbi:nucleotide-binding protein [Microbacterium sp. Leaf151]|uniref:nucleotide-binding protein n=1 Tax=Microbacterium sp. Leaf151 TaxID=1736276 RepID=UPI000AC12C2D
MTPDRTDANPDENAEHGVLDESGNLDTASITILGGHIAQVSVDLPVTGDDDIDDDVIEDEIPIDDPDRPLLDTPYERRSDNSDREIAQVHHVELLPTGDIILEPHDGSDDTASTYGDENHDVQDAELVDDEHGAETRYPHVGDAENAETDDVAHAETHDAENTETHDAGNAGTSDSEHADPRDAENDVDAHGVGHTETHDADDAVAHAETHEAEHAGAHVAEDAEAYDAEHLDVNDAHEPEAAEYGDSSGTGAHTAHAHQEESRHEAEAPHDADQRDGGHDAAPEPGRDAVGFDHAGTREDVRAADLRDAEIVDDVELFEADAADPDEVPAAGVTDVPLPESAHGLEQAPEPSGAPAVRDAAAGGTALTHAPWVPASDRSRTDDDDAVSASAVETDEPASGSATAPEEDDMASDEEAPGVEATASASAGPSATTHPAPQRTGAASTGPVPTPTEAAPSTGDAPASVTAPATGPVAAASDAAPTTGSVPATRAERAATGAIGTLPLTRRGAHQADEAARAADEAARVDRAHAMERVRTPAPEVTLTSKRIGEIDDARESSDLLTADRLLDPRQISKPEPEGLWQQLVYSVSGHRINLGDGRRARDRKDLDQRIAAPLSGGARFVPVLSRKGGVGKTTVTSLLGMALADARDDRIIAVDANPDRGTLADRVGRPNGRTVRDLVRSHDEVAGYHDVSSIVARDATRLDVLASDADPRVSEAFSDDDYRRVADVAAHYYSIVLTDTGTGIVHSVMGATLELAHTVVIVAGLSVDEARLASETLTWLETNGYAARVRDAVVVLNNSRPGAPLVRESELEAHFRSRVRTVIRMPYDARIAAGSAITFRDLQPSTRQAARELAAAVVEGLRSPAAAA